MSLAGVSSYVNPTPVNSPTFYSQRKSDAGQLQQALQSGDLAGAQSAYNALASLQSSTGSGPFPNNKVLSGDFNALGDALQAGNLSAAQQIGAKLRQDIRTAIQNQGGGNAIPAGAQSSVQPEIIINLSTGASSSTPNSSTTDGSTSGTPTATLGSTSPITSSVGTPTSTSPASSTSGVTASTTTSNGVPELILNLGGGAGSPSEIDINFGSAAANSQIQINLGTGSNGQAETIGINLVA
jgi:hypothetical protein